jgi:hypothetical protein
MRKIGADVTETLELIPRRWKVIQHAREKFACRACEAITQPPAPSHPIARACAGPKLLAHMMPADLGYLGKGRTYVSPNGREVTPEARNRVLWCCP